MPLCSLLRFFLMEGEREGPMGRVGGKEGNGDNEWDIRRRMAMKS